jgi:hypothetical protein
MTPAELKRCRAVHNALSLRLRLLKARLRTLVVDGDVLGLGCTNVTSLLMKDDDKIRAFEHCIRLYVSQVFSGFLNDTATAEVERFLCSLETVLVWLATDAIKRHMTPRAAWDAIAGGYDTVTRRDRVTAYALHLVLPKAQDDDDDNELEAAEATT